MPQHITIIYTAICNWLADGQEFTADVKDYAESFLGVCDLAELTSLLSDSDNPDAEPFLEFLIFPDTLLLECLESENTTIFTPADVALLIEKLCTTPHKSSLRDGQERLEFTVPSWMWSSFTERLHLTDTTRSALKELAPDVESVLPISVKAALRRSGLINSPNVHAALLKFFTGIPLRDPLYHDLFSHWISFLNSRPPELQDDGSQQTANQYLESLASFLEQHRRRLYKATIEAQEFAIKLQRFNMETLMMSGDRAPTIDVNTVRFQLRLIDRLALGIFGHPISSIEEQEDRQWGDYVDYRSDLALLPKDPPL